MLTCPPVTSATLPNSTILQSVPFMLITETETLKRQFTRSKYKISILIKDHPTQLKLYSYMEADKQKSLKPQLALGNTHTPCLQPCY